MSEAVHVVDGQVARQADSGTDVSSAVDTRPPTFEEFVSGRSSRLWRTAWLLTGDAHKAEDLLQTALLKAWRRWDEISRDGSVEGYVRRTLVTTYTDWWRRRWTGEVPTETLPDTASSHAADLAALRHDVASALAQLTRGQRAVVVLRYFDDLTEVQTAEALGCSVGTVKSQMSRAMTALRSSPMLAPAQEETP